MTRHGWEPLLGAAQTGGNLLDSATQLFTFRFSDGLLEVLGIVGAFGLFVCVLNRVWLWPLRTALCFLLGSRARLTYAVVPVAGAVAFAIVDVFRWLRVPLPVSVADLFRQRRTAILLSVLLVLASMDSLASRYDARSPFGPVSADELEAMAWVRQNTPADARFMVVSGEPWELDGWRSGFPP